jgi:creatinine amidohydrolase
MSETETEKLWGYYPDLDPQKLADIRAAFPVIYLPWGALEWHGPHLPLGTAGTIAQEMCEQAVRRTGGVLMPTTWLPVTTIPHPHSLSMRASVVRSLWEDLFVRLKHAGWRVVVVVSGHYAQGHELALIEAAEEAINQHNLLVLGVPPLVMVDETMHDHAALWETSMMMLLRPDLVNIDALGNGPLQPAASAVIGQDPRGTASASMGRRALTMATEQIMRAVERLLADGDATPLTMHYEHRRSCLAPFVERYYRGSLEEANKAWWQDVCRNEERP